MGLSANNFTNELKSKLEGIADNAQVNVIEIVKIAGSESALTVTDKTVEIPFATTEAAGVVKLSAEIGVDGNNALKVNSVSTDVLTNGENELILVGGNASLTRN